MHIFTRLCTCLLLTFKVYNRGHTEHFLVQQVRFMKQNFPFSCDYLTQQNNLSYDHWTKSRVSVCFLVYISMAFQMYGSLVCTVTLLALLSLFSLGEGQHKGFRNFNLKFNTRKEALRFEEQWFIQKLDHFNGADSRVWKQVSWFSYKGCCMFRLTF